MRFAYISALFKNTLENAERDADAWRRDAPPTGFDRRTAMVCAVVAVCLTLSNYAGREQTANAISAPRRSRRLSCLHRVDRDHDAADLAHVDSA
jgi:hypothetical protein